MEHNINYPHKKFKIISEYSYYLDEDEDLDLDMEEETPEDVDAELGLDDDQAEGEEMSDGNEVEIDVSDLVSKQEEIISKFDEIISSINGIKANFDSQNEKVAQQVQAIEGKLEQTTGELKNELIKRVPTPNEKLQVQSMNSFPYNVRLSDYWKPAGDENEEAIAMSGSDEKNFLDDTVESKEEKYDLSLQDIEDGYSDISIKNSF